MIKIIAPSNCQTTLSLLPEYLDSAKTQRVEGKSIASSIMRQSRSTLLQFVKILALNYCLAMSTKRVFSKTYLSLVPLERKSISF